MRLPLAMIAFVFVGVAGAGPAVAEKTRYRDTWTLESQVDTKGSPAQKSREKVEIVWVDKVRSVRVDGTVLGDRWYESIRYELDSKMLTVRYDSKKAGKKKRKGPDALLRMMGALTSRTFSVETNAAGGESENGFGAIVSQVTKDEISAAWDAVYATMLRNIFQPERTTRAMDTPFRQVARTTPLVVGRRWRTGHVLGVPTAGSPQKTALEISCSHHAKREVKVAKTSCLLVETETEFRVPPPRRPSRLEGRTWHASYLSKSSAKSSFHYDAKAGRVVKQDTEWEMTIEVRAVTEEKGAKKAADPAEAPVHSIQTRKLHYQRELLPKKK